MLAAAQVGDRDRVADVVLPEEEDERRHRPHRCAVDRHDDVARHEAGEARRSSEGDAVDARTGGHAHARRCRRVDVCAFDAEPGVGDMAVRDEVFRHGVGDVDRRRVPGAVSRLVVHRNRDREADDRAAAVEQRAAGRRARKRSVGLDHVEQVGIVGARQTPPQSADDSDRNPGRA